MLHEHVPGAADRSARGWAPARRRTVSGRGAEGAWRQPAAAQPGQGHHDDQGQAGQGSRRTAGLGAASGGRAADQGAHDRASRQLPGAAGTEVTARGGTVHWARDAAEANRIVTSLVRATGSTEVVKVKSIATDEIGLNDALAKAGISAIETDLAELIVQLGHDRPSHILVPAIHRNRAEIRDIFLTEMDDVDPGLTDAPAALAEAARLHLRRKFLSAKVGISGANFAIAETGTLCVVESEGNGRMCLTLPDTLITVMGIEKVIPSWADLGVFLQLLPRSATGERMNPYTSMWTGVTPGDGPQQVHLVLLDNGRTAALADEVGRPALACIRCSACLNVCPVYERVGGHAYGSVYPGPIGAILSPMLTGVEDNASLPYASSLCGACYDVCPVKIDIPSILVHLRARHVEEAARCVQACRPPRRSRWRRRRGSWPIRPGSPPPSAAGRLGRFWAGAARSAGCRRRCPAGLRVRDAPVPPAQTFRQWWRREHGAGRDAPALRSWAGPHRARDEVHARYQGGDRRGADHAEPTIRLPDDQRTRPGSADRPAGRPADRLQVLRPPLHARPSSTQLFAALAERGARRLSCRPTWTCRLPDPPASPLAASAVVDDGTLTAYAPRLVRRRDHDSHRRHRRDRDDHSRRLPRPGPPRADPDPRLPPVRSTRHQIVGLVPEAVALLTRQPPAHLDQRPLGHQRHRTRPSRRRPRPAHPRSDLGQLTERSPSH